MEDKKLTQLKSDFDVLTSYVYQNTKSVELGQARELLIKLQEVEKGIDELIEDQKKAEGTVTFEIKGDQLVGVLKNYDKGQFRTS